MKRKPKKALGVFSRRLACWVLGLWLVCVSVLTIAVGQLYYNSLLHAAEQFGERVFYYPSLGDLYDRDAEDDHLPGFAEHRLLMACDHGNDCWAQPSVTHERWSFLNDAGRMTQSAVVIGDYTGQTHYTNGDYYYFPCATEEEWMASVEPSGEITRYAWVRFDPETFTDEGKTAYEKEPDAWFWTMRFTGMMEGNQMIPDRIEMIDYAEQSDRGNFYQNLRRGYLSWTTLYERETPKTVEPTVLYTVGHIDVSVYDPGKPVRYEGRRYDSLQDMTREMLETHFSQPDAHGDFTVRDYSLLRFVSMESFHMSDSELGPDGLLQHERLYCVTSALYASPLLMAVYSLRWVYAGTFALAALLLWRMGKLFSRKVMVPLNTVNGSISAGWNNIWALKEQEQWQELSQLIAHYTATQATLRDDRNEIARLQKALGFAKTAEENRRQMTSAIAHELKTPLAVIHSYAEGLQERIREEKRDQYLEIILSECRRMDGMVLEMLDLSRLEAGKVKLAQDAFNLCDMTRNTFDRLALALEAKELELICDFRCDGQVVADEGRMEQVVTNLATNAVKYARFGGRITVKIQSIDGKTRFTMENHCDPLPQEALARLWDTFYRVDASRSGEGTGLGLAICKSIVELHGGNVMAYNTLNGVAFVFVI